MKLTNNKLEQLITEFLNESSKYDEDFTDIDYVTTDQTYERDENDNVFRDESGNPISDDDVLDNIKNWTGDFDISGEYAYNQEPDDHGGPYKAVDMGKYIDFSKKVPFKTVTKKTPVKKTKTKSTPAKTTLSNKEKFSYTTSNIPDDVKDLILFTFKGLSGATEKDKLDDFASIAESLIKENKKEIDWMDFDTLLSDPSNPMHKDAIRAVLVAKNNLGSADNNRAALEKILQQYQVQGVVQTDDAADEIDMSSPVANLSDLYAGGGADARKRTPQYILDLFNSLGLSTTTTFKERIEIINEATKMVTDKDQHSKFANDYGIGEAIGILSIMDMMSKIVRTMDAKPSGWVFEHFLAQLANGTQEGDDYGAADYQYGLPTGMDAKKTTGKSKVGLNVVGGSAKLLNSNGFEQATLPKSLKNKGDAIVYVVGIKKEKASQIKKLSQGTSKTQKIKMVDIYITPVWQNSTRTGVYRTKAGGVSSAGQYKVSPSEYIGTIYLADSAADLADLSGQVLDKVNAELPVLYQKMELFRKQTSSYLTAGQVGSGEKSAKAYAELYASINKVFAAKTQETGVEIQLTGGASLATTTTSALEESKLQSLDQLIAETMRDIRRKTKK